MGRVAFAFFVLFGMVAQAFAADGPLGVGSIKLGMTYDEVKAATPGVTWTNTDYGSLFSDDAMALGKDRFAVGYSLGAWGRISLRARHVNTESDAEACLTQLSAMTEDAEASIASFGIDPLKILAQEQARRMISKTPPAVTITVIKIGKRSSAALTRPEVPDGSENAANFYAGSWFRADKNEAEITARYSQSASGRRCELEISLKYEPPRPPYGDIAFDDLVVIGRPSVGWLHHSLDGAPALPAEGIDVSFSCSIPGGSGGFTTGFTTCESLASDIAKPFMRAARNRLSYVKVADKTRDGRWTPQEKTTVRIHLAPSDRRENLALNAGQQDLIVFEKKPRRPMQSHYLISGLSEPHVAYGCVVQSDLSLICPKIEVSPKATFQAEDLRKQALFHLMGHRVAPKLKNGKTAVGAVFIGTFNFESNLTKRSPKPPPQ